MYIKNECNIGVICKWLLLSAFREQNQHTFKPKICNCNICHDLPRGLEQDGMMKMKGPGRSMMFSYDELRSHFPYLIPQAPVLPTPQPSVSAAYLQELQAHAHAQIHHSYVPLQTYPAYVSGSPHPRTSTCTSTHAQSSSLSLSSETSAFEPIYSNRLSYEKL